MYGAGGGIVLYGAALSGSFPDELVIVVDDALEVAGAVVELPELLVDGGLVVEYVDDQLLIDVFAAAGSILQYFF